MPNAFASWVRLSSQPFNIKRTHDLRFQVDDFHTMERFLSRVLQRRAHEPTPIIEDQMSIMEHVTTSNLDLKTFSCKVDQCSIEACFNGIWKTRGKQADFLVHRSKTIKRSHSDVGVDH
jgi:hypothetical protein